MARVLRPSWWRGPSIDRGVADTPKRLYPVRYDIKRSHFSLLFGNRHGNRLRKDIQTSKFYSLHRPARSLVALDCLSSDSQHNPRPRIVAGHSILTSRKYRCAHPLAAFELFGGARAQTAASSPRPLTSPSAESLSPHPSRALFLRTVDFPPFLWRPAPTRFHRVQALYLEQEA